MMINAKLTRENYLELRKTLGKEFISFECAELDSYNRTYGNMRLNFDGTSLEICNEQKPLKFYDDIEDVAYFNMQIKKRK